MSTCFVNVFDSFIEVIKQLSKKSFSFLNCWKLCWQTKQSLKMFE